MFWVGEGQLIQRLAGVVMLPAFHAKGGATQGGDVTVVKTYGVPEKETIFKSKSG